MQDALAATEDGPVLAVVRDPVSAVALRVEGGSSAEEALAGWMSAAETLLDVQRRERRRVTLVDVRVLGDPTPIERAALEHRFGTGPGFEGTDAVRPQEAGAFDRVCAAALVSADRRARALADELAAATIGGDRPGVGIADVAAARGGPVGPDTETAAVPAAGPRPAARDLPADPDALDGLRSALQAVSAERDLLRETIDLQLSASEELVVANEALENENAALLTQLVDYHVVVAERSSLDRRYRRVEHERKRREAVLGARLLDALSAAGGVGADAAPPAAPETPAVDEAALREQREQILAVQILADAALHRDLRQRLLADPSAAERTT